MILPIPARRRRRALAALLLAALSAGAAPAAQRFATAEEAARWGGVGLIGWRGKAGCTGVLVRPDTVLTAAHCVSDAARRVVFPAEEITFSAGYVDGRQIDAAYASRIEVHPGYFSAGRSRNRDQIRSDVARIILERPLSGAPVYGVDYAPATGASVTLVSYSQGRMSRPSVQDRCRILGRETEFVELDCASAPGASGAPYFRVGPDGRAHVVGIHSGRSHRSEGGKAHALGLDHVRDFLGAAGPGPAVGPARGGAFGSSAPPAAGARLPGGSRPGDGLSRLRR